MGRRRSSVIANNSKRHSAQWRHLRFPTSTHCVPPAELDVAMDVARAVMEAPAVLAKRRRNLQGTKSCSKRIKMPASPD